MPALKLGLIGIGHVAEAQIEAIQQVESVVLTAAHDIDLSKKHFLPEGVKFFESLDLFLECDDVDLFLVSTPNLTHASIGARVLQAGRSLLLEKPVSHDRNELKFLCKTASSSKAYFSVALHATYAREVVWWKENNEQFNYEWGPLTGFECGFFDPYVSNGCVLKSAIGLGGSWFDSGINALSVVGLFIEPQSMSIQDSRMTRLDGVECSQIQGSSTFSFSVGEKGVGRGSIDTNWALGVNRKITRLFYDNTGYEIILHHSKEFLRIEHHGEIIFEKYFSDGNTRLSNHYIGLFEDQAIRYRENRSNIEYADAIHQILFDSEAGCVLRKDG